MARSQNSFIKKQKAEKKRKRKEEKFKKRLEKKNKTSSGDLSDMIAYVNKDGNITSAKEEESIDEK